MAATKKPYQLLPGTGYRRTVSSGIILLLFFVIGIFALLLRGRRIQLWQGEEHLLVVETDGYKEYYKRFNYRDIQAIVVRRTVEGKIVNGILMFITCLFAAVAIPVTDLGARIFLLCIAGFFGLVLLINALYGATCQAYLRTAVQIEELPSLNRLPRARKVLNRLRPFITAAQGQLAPEEIAGRMREMIQSPGAATGSGAAPQAFIVDDPNAPPRINS